MQDVAKKMLIAEIHRSDSTFTDASLVRIRKQQIEWLLTYSNSECIRTQNGRQTLWHQHRLTEAFSRVLKWQLSPGYIEENLGLKTVDRLAKRIGTASFNMQLILEVYVCMYFIWQNPFRLQIVVKSIKKNRHFWIQPRITQESIKILSGDRTVGKTSQVHF